jgi:hypothetical protein
VWGKHKINMKDTPFIKKTNSSEELWKRFKESLTKSLKDISINELKKHFENRPAITKFYKEVLLPKISTDLGFTLGHEWLRIDHNFNLTIPVKDGKEEWHYPIVFIESENDINSLNEGGDNDELYKLCYLNVPLKLIFSWNYSWTQNERDKFIREWQFSIDTFLNANRLIGYLGIIIADQATGKFQYSIFIWDEAGKIKEESVIYIDN